MKIQERWGLLLSSLTIAIFWCNKLLILAEHPFIWDTLYSYTGSAWQYYSAFQWHTKQHPYAMRTATAVKYLCRRHPCNTCIWRDCFPLSWCGTAPNLVFWSRDVGSLWSEVTEVDMHCLLLSLMGEELQVSVGGWVTPLWRLELMAALRHGACVMRSDTRGLTETSVTCSWGCSWLTADFPACNHFLLSRNTS